MGEKHRHRGKRLRAILFDFGGVLAEEGFREGLKALASRFGLEPEGVYDEGAEAVYVSGYVLGRGSEESFWRLLCQKTGLPPYTPDYTEEILDRFILRPAMLEAVRGLRRGGFLTAILSDQTDWLDRLEVRHSFFGHFDRVFNSYHLGKGKRDPSLFSDVAKSLGIEPAEALFIDDNVGNIERASAMGLNTILFADEKTSIAELANYTGRPSIP